MRILVVDDDPDLCTLYRNVFDDLADGGVDVANDASQAMSHALADTYDLITLDICMPGVDGLTIAPMLRNMNPHAIIAVISGNLDIGEETPDTVDVVMAKPVTVRTLHELVDHARTIQNVLGAVRAMGVKPTALSTS